jgi:hypothetical protein
MAVMWPVRGVIGLLAIFAVIGQSGCVGPFVPPPPPPPSMSAQPRPSDVPTCTAPVSSVAPDAALLVGEWVCTASTTEMRFRFSSDGTYVSREALEYNIPSGRFVFHRDQAGTYVTAGDRLELTPTRSSRTRRMPEDPGGDYIDKPEPLDRRVFTFRAEQRALHLHEEGGYALILQRVS